MSRPVAAGGRKPAAISGELSDTLNCYARALRTPLDFGAELAPGRYGPHYGEQICQASISIGAKLLEGMGALGASALLQAALPIRLARAGELVSGFVYIGPRLDWGWNESFAVAAVALKGFPTSGSCRRTIFPRAPTTGAARTMRKPEPTARRWSA